MLRGHEETIVDVGSRGQSPRYATALTTRALGSMILYFPSRGGAYNMTEYPWWEPYKFAVLETDRKKLKDRVIAAEQAIRARASLDGQVSSDERIAIQDAISALQMLKR